MFASRYLNSARSLLVFALLLGAGNACADGPFLFGPPTVLEFDTPHFPTMVAIGDIDADGDPDVVVPGRNSEGLAYIIINQGSGSYASPMPMELTGQSDWVEIVDLDGDGHVDLVFAMRSNNGRLQIAWGTGSGEFEKKMQTLRLKREPRCVEVADLDGDGNLDLAVANYGSSDVQVIRNLGRRNFGEPDGIAIAREMVGSASLQEVEAGDLDGDGDLDLVAVTIGSSRAYFLRNRGDGTFEIPEGWGAPGIEGETGGLTAVELGDIDGDGDLDAVVPLIFLDAPSQIGIFRNDGNMVVESRGVHQATSQGYAFSLALADLDNDGDLDPLVGCAIPGPLQVLDNRTVPVGDGGDGTLAFQPPQMIANDSFFRGVSCADMDGDCDMDVLAVDLVSNILLIIPNLTPQEDGCGGAPFTGETYVRAVHSRRAPPARIVDMNGDGHVDGRDIALRMSMQGGVR